LPLLKFQPSYVEFRAGVNLGNWCI